MAKDGINEDLFWRTAYALYKLLDVAIHNIQQLRQADMIGIDIPSEFWDRTDKVMRLLIEGVVKLSVLHVKMVIEGEDLGIKSEMDRLADLAMEVEYIYNIMREGFMDET